jgi:hypothetical protein
MPVSSLAQDTAAKEAIDLLDLDLDITSLGELFTDDWSGGVILASTLPIPGCP